MWDIGGQESLRQAWSTYYSGTHFMILVVDSTDRERLAVTKEELYRMLGNEVYIRMCTSVHEHTVHVERQANGVFVYCMCTLGIHGVYTVTAKVNLCIFSICLVIILVS